MKSTRKKPDWRSSRTTPTPDSCRSSTRLPAVPSILFWSGPRSVTSTSGRPATGSTCGRTSSRVFRYPPKTLIYLVSRNIQQLNLPISPSEADAGMSSELIRLSDPATRAIPFTGWLRRSAATGAVIYAGFYTTCELPDHGGRFVKVVFPLPDGSATVVLRPENRPDGSFALVSNGDGFGDAGYYRVHRGPDGTLLAKYMPVKEEIHVYVDRSGTLRTTHTLALWKARFLTLRYEISRHGQGRSLPSSSCQ